MATCTMSIWKFLGTWLFKFHIDKIFIYIHPYLIAQQEKLYNFWIVTDRQNMPAECLYKIRVMVLIEVISFMNSSNGWIRFSVITE